MWRTGAFASTIFLSATISAAHAVRGRLEFPSLSFVLQLAGESAIVFVPTTLLLAATGAYAGLRLGPPHMKRRRLSIAAIMYATTALAVAIAWKSHLDFERGRDALGNPQLLNLSTVFLVAPVCALLIVLAAFCAQSARRCLVLLLAVTAISLSLASLGQSAGRPGNYTIGLCATFAWITISTGYIRFAAGWRFGSERTFVSPTVTIENYKSVQTGP